MFSQDVVIFVSPSLFFFFFLFCFTITNQIWTYLLAIDWLSQAKPEMVIGRQFLCLYPDPRAFSLLLFLGSVLAHWGWSMSRKLWGGLAVSRTNLLLEWMGARPPLGQAYKIHTEEHVWINPQGQYHSTGIKGSGYKSGTSFRSGLPTRDWLAWKEQVSLCQSAWFKRSYRFIMWYPVYACVSKSCRVYMGIPVIWKWGIWRVGSWIRRPSSFLLAVSTLNRIATSCWC